MLICQFPQRLILTLLQVFGNSNSLPISLVLSLSQTIKGLHWDKVPRDNDDEVAARGILYLLIFQQLGQLVRWSWGYNVLLAPPEQIQGTDENNISRLEDGHADLQASQSLLGDMSSDEEGDDLNTSGSDDTRVGCGNVRDRKMSSPQAGQTFQSGQQTPVTHRQHASSFSSGTSDDRLAKTAPATDLFPTPVNGNVKPSGEDERMLSFPTICADTDPGNAKTADGLKGIPTRCKIAAIKVSRAVSRWIRGVITSMFQALPFPIQRPLATVGSAVWRFLLGVWSFMNPPLWAMLAAIIVASIPDLQRFFFADGTFFKNSVTSAIRQSGGVAVPLILVVLGANLARNTLPHDPNHTREDDKEETKILIAALISRMLLPTVIMAPLLAITAKYIPVSILDDPIFIIVCFLITGAPSALQLAQICQINNVYMGAMSRLLFQSYVVWILPSTLVLVMCALEVVEWAQR